MHGTNILRNKINKFKALSARQQKAMYNSNTGPQPFSNNNIGNSNPFQQAAAAQQQQQQPPPVSIGPPSPNTGGPGPGAEKLIRMASGKEVKASERPDLARLAARPKRYPRRNRR